MLSPREAEDKVLRYVRTQVQGIVMRNLSNGEVGVVDVSRYPSKVLVRATTWAAVAIQLGLS